MNALTVLLALIISSGGAVEEAGERAIYRSEGKVIVVDWAQRITGVVHDGVSPEMLLESFKGEPQNTWRWKNRLSCGVTTPFAQLAIPRQAGRTVTTQRYVFKESPGANESRLFATYNKAGMKLIEYEYRPRLGVISITVLNIETGLATQRYQLESGAGFLSHCGW